MKKRRYLGKRKQEDQDFELNIAPIIDCFTVLITFLLVSATFISLGVLDSSSTENSAVASQPEKETVELAVELKASRKIALHVTGAAKEELEIEALADSWNYPVLEEKIGAMKQRWPALSSANLGADNTVEYKELIHSMEKIREHIPNVYLDAEADR